MHMFCHGWWCLYISFQLWVHWKPIRGRVPASGRKKKNKAKKQTHHVQPGVCLNARIPPLPDAKHLPISPPIVRRALPWRRIPGQGLAVVQADPGRRPLTFRPGPGSEGQRWPEGNKSTSMIGTLTCSPQRSPASRFCASHLHPLQGEDHRG